MEALTSASAWRPTLIDRVRSAVGLTAYRVRQRLNLLPESNAEHHAKRELALIRSGEPDEMQDAIERHVLKMIREFSREGHSGMSASYTIGLLEKLLRFEPVTPLTGASDEWNEVGEGHWQNNRCGRVFKDADGRTYDIEGRVFVDPDGGAYLCRESRVYVTFPYRPKTEYVRRPVRDARGRFSAKAEAR